MFANKNVCSYLPMFYAIVFSLKDVTLLDGPIIVPSFSIDVPLHWRRTSHVRHGVSNHRQIQWPVNSPHKGPVMRKVSCAMTLLYNDHFQSALLALCERNPLIGVFPSQRPVTRSFDVLSDARLNKRLSKPSRCRRFETPWRSLWRQCNDTIMILDHVIKSRGVDRINPMAL